MDDRIIVRMKGRWESVGDIFVTNMITIEYVNMFVNTWLILCFNVIATNLKEMDFDDYISESL